MSRQERKYYLTPEQLRIGIQAKEKTFGRRGLSCTGVKHFPFLCQLEVSQTSHANELKPVWPTIFKIRISALSKSVLHPPSSRPSPQGEGELCAGSLKYLRLNLPQDHQQNENRASRFLLLGEKVRLRADRNTILMAFPRIECRSNRLGNQIVIRVADNFDPGEFANR